MTGTRHNLLVDQNPIEADNKDTHSTDALINSLGCVHTKYQNLCSMDYYTKSFLVPLRVCQVLANTTVLAGGGVAKNVFTPPSRRTGLLLIVAPNEVEDAFLVS